MPPQSNAQPQQQKTKSNRPKKTSITDIGRDYVGRNRDKLIFSRGSWWYWNGVFWQQVHDLVQRHEFWKLVEQYESRDGAQRGLGDVKALEDYVKSKMFIDEESLDARTDLINLQNWVYNITDGNVYPHDPNYYMTTCLPFDYDPNARPTYFPMFLMTSLVEPRSTVHDKELAEFLQEAVGYSLTTDVSHHVTFWLVGEGANGKGVFFHVLEKLAGNSAMALNVGLLSREQYQLANLAGKRIALCSEASATKNLVDDAIIKQIVSADTISVRAIRKEPFDLHPTVKLWWSMNEVPSVADTSDGYWRRMRIIPFNRTFQENERIPDLKERLDMELPGIFNWAMEGLKRLRTRGKFDMPKQIMAATEKYRNEANPIKMFVDDCCEFDVNFSCNVQTMYDRYKEWSFANGFRQQTRKNFSHEMERLHFYREKRNIGTVFVGVQIKPNMQSAKQSSYIP